MPRLRNSPPGYSLHKASGQAYVWLNGREHYLGKYGSPDSRVAYQRIVAEWLASKAVPISHDPIKAEAVRADLRINELLVAYLEFAAGYYTKNGRPTGELANMKDAVKPLQALYETLPVSQFGPTGPRAVRERMIGNGFSRKVVNARINRVRRIFKWGVERELIAPGVLQGLQSVAPLKQGRSEARETSRVLPVPQAHIDAVVPHVTRPVKAMIELQLVTGMRPGEVVLMRTCDVDTSGRIWEYRPESHKTQHHGIERIIFLGPLAQGIVRPFLKTDLTEYLFSPSDAVLAARRKLKPRRGRSRRTLRIRGYRRCPSDRCTRGSYQTAIYKACVKANIPPWGPNRLRHNAATFLRKEFGVEAARVILGHASAAITEVYAEIDRKKAAEIPSPAVIHSQMKARRPGLRAGLGRLKDGFRLTSASSAKTPTAAAFSLLFRLWLGGFRLGIPFKRDRAQVDRATGSRARRPGGRPRSRSGLDVGNRELGRAGSRKGLPVGCGLVARARGAT
jgi:integrase